LEPLSGYLWLAARLSTSQPLNDSTAKLCSAFNFGPDREANRTVYKLVEEILKHWPGEWVDKSNPHAVHEARLLHLVTTKAKRELGWQPVWNFSETIKETVGWYHIVSQTPARAQEILSQDIADYCAAAKKKKLPWAV
jgi:CDP-glucose 4,6-dehydratase